MNLNYMNYQMDKNGIAEIIISQPGEKINTLSYNLMHELDFLINHVAEESRVKALIISSGKKDTFIAGADISEIIAINGPEAAEKTARLGQEVLGNIASLPFPSIALIDGACMGGGLECALACTFRIVSDNPKTKLALPEVTLGLIPGFGGTVRLPLLIGLIPALDMIVTGKSVSGKEAAAIKLADAIFPQECINDGARTFALSIIDRKTCRAIIQKRNTRSFRERISENTWIGRHAAFNAAERMISENMNGFSDALHTALAVIKKNFHARSAAAFRIEREGFASLAGSPASKNMISVFRTINTLKKAYTTDTARIADAETMHIRSAAVIGGEKTAEHIIRLFLQAGIPAAALHINDDTTPVSSDIIFETGEDDFTTKKKTLADAEKICSPDTIIAVHTSSLSVDGLAADHSRPGNIIGFHICNPAAQNPLAEIIRTGRTSEITLYRTVLLARRLGMTPIVVKDVCGFLVNRILMAYLNEAVLLLENGADVETVDTVMEQFGMQTGPFALLDIIGIKTAYRAAEILSHAYPEQSVPGGLFPIIGGDATIAGRGSGVGFYIYTAYGKRPNPRIKMLLEKIGQPRRTVSRDEILNRCTLRMLGEAVRCLEEGIVSSAAELDAAVILGAGFPRCRGGILRYAEATGIAELRNLMKGYCTHYGPRFDIPALLEDCAKNGGVFYNAM